jgi:hypothetical protein
MSSIEITDLDSIDIDLLKTLTDAEIADRVIGGSNSMPTSINANVMFLPYSSSTSISIANATRSSAIVTTVNANFNANFTVNSSHNGQSAIGSIGMTIEPGNILH